MTEVLSIVSGSDSNLFGAPLARKSAQSPITHTPTYSHSAADYRPRYTPASYDSRYSVSEPSTATSSPRLTAPGFSDRPSYTSTPSSSLSLNDSITQEDEEICFPSYDSAGFFDEVDEPDPPSSPISSYNSTISNTPADAEPARHPSALQEPKQVAGDDMNLQTEPSRHVDYLSHSWKEEDIWASWRHIVGRRKLYSNSVRLENASWRTWAKTKGHLKTVSPASLNWMKDHDVTWLYGPLQTGSTHLFLSQYTPPASQISRSNSFTSKKPILKKRSLSEIMLQRSLSSSTLMKQATDAVRAQQPGTRSGLGSRVASDLMASSGSETPLTRASTHTGSSDLSTSSSGLQTPSIRRHIHFNNKVEQCIAINKDHDEPLRYFHALEDDGESSGDDLLTMQPVRKHKTKTRTPRPSTPRGSFSNESKTIAMLPSTTLNYRGDTPEPAEQVAKQRNTLWGQGAKLSPSPSQQTIRPASSSSNFLLDEESDTTELDWQANKSRGGSIFPRGGFEMHNEDDDEDADELHRAGLHRTPSGMFMPDDEDDGLARDGILGRVVDTVNTAKDIAHVIWNVGWRR